MKQFLGVAEAEVRTLASLYSAVVRICPFCGYFWTSLSIDMNCVLVMAQGKNVDALILYFGEDPARCPFEQGSLPKKIISYAVWHFGHVDIPLVAIRYIKTSA